MFILGLASPRGGEHCLYLDLPQTMCSSHFYLFCFIFLFGLKKKIKKRKKKRIITKTLAKSHFSSKSINKFFFFLFLMETVSISCK